MDEMSENNLTESEDEINKLVRDTRTINTIFNEPMNLLRDLNDSFGRKNYATTLENGRKIMDMMEEPIQKFVKVGMAFSISAATEWLSTLAEVGVDITRAEDMITEAREHFFDGDYHKANETIGKVSDMIPELEAEQERVAKEGISSAEELINDARDIGATIYSAERALQQARNSLEVENYLEVGRLAKEAKEAAERAREQRIQTISDALLFTSSIIDESREVGVNVSETEGLHNEAKAAFDAGEYKRCTELNKKAEERALRMQEEHIKRVMELKEKREAMMRGRPRVEERAAVEERPMIEEQPRVEERAMPEEQPQAAPSYGVPVGMPTGYEPTSYEEPTTEETPSEEPAEDVCPVCSSQMRYIQKYDRYWCNRCQKYAPKH